MQAISWVEPSWLLVLESSTEKTVNAGIVGLATKGVEKKNRATARPSPGTIKSDRPGTTVETLAYIHPIV